MVDTWFYGRSKDRSLGLFMGHHSCEGRGRLTSAAIPIVLKAHQFRNAQFQVMILPEQLVSSCITKFSHLLIHISIVSRFDDDTNCWEYLTNCRRRHQVLGEANHRFIRDLTLSVELKDSFHWWISQLRWKESFRQGLLWCSFGSRWPPPSLLWAPRLPWNLMESCITTHAMVDTWIWSWVYHPMFERIQIWSTN